MDVTIVISEQDRKQLIVQNVLGDESLVKLMIHDQINNDHKFITISTEELRHALRKISVK